VNPIRMLMSLFCILVLTLVVNPANAIAETLISHAPGTARAYFITPENNVRVGETFKVKFGLTDMGVAPAGVDIENTGHHHLLIDLDELPELDQPLPKNEQILHFGGGQTETSLTLPSGKHTLQLVLGNYQHIPHDHPVMSNKITVTVG
jgi:hypothetical protein